MLILGIESSCDDTAAAVVEGGVTILSSAVSSQIEVHHKYGGVVPELASRKHIEAITNVVKEALLKADVKKENINAVAVTKGPGLVGSLLIGFSFAKAFSYALKIPYSGVNHLKGHISAVFLESNPPSFPFTALLVSGGHTSIYYVTSHTEYELMGRTRDDAAGEAYDKVSKMLGLGYPGGKIIDDLAKKGDPQKIVFPKPYLNKNEFDFSFSGLKSAVKRYIQTHETEYKSYIKDIAAGFQESVVEVLTYKIINAAIQKKCKTVVVAGGVAANSALRKRIIKEGEKSGLSIHIPSPYLCTDNAAMIAAAGFHKIKNKEFGGLDTDVFSRISA
jgi:N6-L-threonylcarbamoyladenine synthase